MGAASCDGPYARTAISHGSLLRWRERLPTDATRAYWGSMHLRHSWRTYSGTSADPTELRYFQHTTAHKLAARTMGSSDMAVAKDGSSFST